MNKIINKNYDIFVVGAGMIGAAVAIGLAREGFQILLLEKIKPIFLNPFSKYPDLRVSALSQASVNLLKRLEIWNNISKMRVTPYRKLEVWEKRNAHLTFEANSLGLSELGYIIENRILKLALWQQFSLYSNITLLCPAKLVAMQRCHQKWKIILNNNQQFLTKLVVAADGIYSKVRSLVGIGTNGWYYNQACLLITVKLKQSSQDVTWQQFFPSGPRAFLPLFDHWACLVWYDKPIKIKQLQDMSLKQLKQEIISAFPNRFDLLQIISKGNFLLNRHHVNRYVEEGLVLIGDAAHSINPLAGQGLNLGYRDVDSLLKVLINAKKHLLSIYDKEVLLAYQKDRMLDNKLMQVGMDIIYFLFGSQLSIAKISRNFALMLLQRSNDIKKK